MGESIANRDFKMQMAGTSSGALYGSGAYFADSITKADEYSQMDANGRYCVLVARVLGGRVLYNDDVEPNAAKLENMVIEEGYNCVLGDREKCRGTYKEYVVFDRDQVYLEYIL